MQMIINTTGFVARKLKKHQRTVRRMCETGVLTGVKAFGEYYIDKNCLDNFIEKF